MTTLESTRTPSGRVTLVAGARLPLAFIAFGLLSLAVAVTMLAVNPQLMLLPHVHPHVVALAHLWLPGFLLTVSMGAVYQLMPVVLGAPVAVSERAMWVHFALHSSGLTLLVSGFLLARFEIVALGGVGVTLGANVLLVAAWRTFRTCPRRDAVAWSFPLAVSWLNAAMVLGVLMAWNRRSGFLPLGVTELLRAHAHVGLGGFFLTLLQGATFQLVPMFTMADLRRPGAVRLGLILSQAGLLVLTPGLACGRAPVAIVGGVVLAAGVVSSGVALGATFRSRRRRMLEPGLKAFGFGAALLGVAALGSLGLVVWSGGVALANVYGIVVIGGALALMVLGMLCKIVPFLVWMKVYGPRAGRQPVPLATTLGSRGWERAWLGLHVTAIALLAGGAAASAITWVAAGAAVLAGAILFFLINMARIGSHLVRVQRSVAAMS